MSDYRRAYVPGGSFFFTLVTERSAPIFRTKSLASLGIVLRDYRKCWPFRKDALVLLDDHLHAMWTLPEGDTRYSACWGWIKLVRWIRR